jgi:hypothetical protein
MTECTSCKGLGWRLRALEQGGVGPTPEETINKLQTEPDYQVITIIPIEPWIVMRLEVTLLANDVDNSSRATFKRMGLFYREDGIVKHQGTFWHTVDTTKSHAIMNIDYILTADSIVIRTRNAGSIATFWTGIVKKLVI